MSQPDSTLPVLQTTQALRDAVADARAAGARRLALVPTMGNLHAGHIELVREARRQGDFVIASVFVNPLQFGEGEDYAEYPRTLAADADKLVAEGVDAVFAPSNEQMYPYGDSATRVRVDGLSDILCGAARPGHFVGVTTVVTMLFNLVTPDLAVFGRKDYQQLVLIRRMVADLHMPVEILAVPTAREADGLALSSRNQYLTADERSRAPALYASLQVAEQALQAGRRDYRAIENEGLARLREAGFTPDYFAVRTPELALPTADSRSLVVLAAAWLGSARLIDNIPVSLRAA